MTCGVRSRKASAISRRASARSSASDSADTETSARTVESASEAPVSLTDSKTMTVNSPIWIKGQEKVTPRYAPAVGEHSDEVLRAAGYSDTEIGALRGEGVIG